MILVRIGAFAALLCLCFPAAAEPAKIALIISNKDYPASIGRLENTHRDGELIGAALRELGFAVEHKRDLNREQMTAEVAAHVARLTLAGRDAAGFFYYSGHGAANSKYGENYLIPVGASISADTQLPLLAVELGRVVDSIAATPAKANFVVFDACRNVPISFSVKSAQKGFRAEKSHRGLLIAFATEPGNVATDEGVYASALADMIKQPGIEATQVFREVRRRVLAATNHQQFPWTAESMEEDYYFRSVTKIKPPPPSPLPPAPPPSSISEEQFQTALDYATGRRGQKNDETAVYYYRRAAAQGHAAAMHNLAVRLYLGQGVRPDGQEALLWYQRAAENGYPKSMYVLAVRYVKGIDVRKSNREGAIWMIQALSNGSEDAFKEMTSNDSMWNPEFIKEIQRQLRDKGFYSGQINGAFSTEFKDAVRSTFRSNL